MMRKFLGLAAAAAVLAPAAAGAQTQPPLDINKLKYEPIGHFKPGDAIPADYGKACESLKPLRKGQIFNPSGVWNSFDNTIFEYYCLPYRDQGDKSANDPEGNGGEARYGYCKNPEITSPLPNSFYDGGGAGVCPNHQLEYIEYFKATMLEVLKDFNPTFHEYDWQTSEGTGRLPAVIVAGSDHPEEQIVIGSHYDQTKTGPASLWDSQEGHAEMIRVAKLMADYWKSTGTRPSATVKFMPMDAEEDGSLGSKEYVTNVIPGLASRVRSYWNADPCAGGYPAWRYGNPADVIPLNIQVGTATNARITAFNDQADDIMEQTLDHIDDSVYVDQVETFVSTAENAVLTDVGKHIFVSTDHPTLFSSDWTNFIGKGIPIFNPTPKVTGPGGASAPAAYTAQNPYPDGLFGFHSPLDNLQTMSRFTGHDPRGNTYPEAYIKGMEFCSHLLAWGMLQHNAGGAQTANSDPVPYFEVLPLKATKGTLTTLDASGSYQYADAGSHTTVDPTKLQFRWDFGDGSPTAYGRVVKHAYKSTGTFSPTLTVTNRASGVARTMNVPVTVGSGSGNQSDPAGQTTDDPARGA
jgi:hypothetical protein